EVDFTRDSASHCSFHFVLWDPLHFWNPTHARDERFRTLAGVPALDIWLRHRALPADGRRHYLQARRLLHLGDSSHRWRLFRRGGQLGRRIPREVSGHRNCWVDRLHYHHCAAVSAPAELVPGPCRPSLLPHQVRLSADSDRVWPRIELRDRPGCNAYLGD